MSDLRKAAGVLALVVAAIYTPAAADRSQTLAGRIESRTAPDGASAWQRSFASRLRLVAAATGSPADTLEAGVEIVLEPGWKTYWRNPGDSGIAPVFDFSGSVNVADVDVAYPVPDRFDMPGDISFGYADRVVFPLTVTPAEPGLPVSLSVHVNYGVCEELCIPVDAQARLDWTDDAPSATLFAGDLALWRDKVPAAGNLTVESLDLLEGDGKYAQLRIAVTVASLTAGEDLADPHLIVEQTGGPARVYFGVPELHMGEMRAVAEVPVRRLSNQPGLEAGARLLLTLAVGGRAHTAIADISASGR